MPCSPSFRESGRHKKAENHRAAQSFVSTILRSDRTGKPRRSNLNAVGILIKAVQCGNISLAHTPADAEKVAEIARVLLNSGHGNEKSMGARLMSALRTSDVRLVTAAASAEMKQAELLQRDKHHREKMEFESGILDLRMRRAEEGKPNDCVAVQVTPVRELPLPAALVQYRRKLLEPSES